MLAREAETVLFHPPTWPEVCFSPPDFSNMRYRIPFGFGVWFPTWTDWVQLWKNTLWNHRVLVLKGHYKNYLVQRSLIWDHYLDFRRPVNPLKLHTKFRGHRHFSRKKIYNFYQIHNKKFPDPKGSIWVSILVHLSLHPTPTLLPMKNMTLKDGE